jgi:hypothetical protein
VSGEQLQSMAEDLLRTSSASREAMANLVRFELEKGLGRLGLATADEVNALSAKVRNLEAKLREATAIPPGTIESRDGPPVGAEVVANRTVAKKTLAKKAVAKKAVANKAVPTKAVAKKAVASKAVAKKAVPTKVVAKKTVPGTGVPAAPGAAEPLAPPAARKAVKRVAAVRTTSTTRKAAPRRPAGGVA